ncbi:IcmT/TraK family protein [Telmatospirillum siberiense]|uniref:Type IV secretion protein IcmT n=1 Tax=Telmatospirillum siberiense TaxID=382514 RepID=A0A2N3PNH3_9PROT|nr:IcmT/TraK family protein [Telmatospirillum siberiense]PKU21947.1 hypothetical protein CWS72_23885 [Telmatospirillum siberiense]
MAWRDSMRPARLFGLDARLIWVVVTFLFCINKMTFILLLVVLTVLIVVERHGLNLPSAIRLLRCHAAGSWRSAIPKIKRRRLFDSGIT